jgi:hypothetical protein
MPRDSIIEEVRATREAIAREHGNDVKAIIEALQRQDAATGQVTVSLPAKRLRKTQAGRKAG